MDPGHRKRAGPRRAQTRPFRSSDGAEPRWPPDSLQQFIHSDAQHLGKDFQLYICYKPFSTLNPLNGIFIHVHSCQLKQIGQPPLRHLGRHSFAKPRHLLTAQIAPAFRPSVFIHFYHP